MYCKPLTTPCVVARKAADTSRKIPDTWNGLGSAGKRKLTAVAITAITTAPAKMNNRLCSAIRTIRFFIVIGLSPGRNRGD